MKKINTFIIEEYRNNIRKTDQFIKFIQLLIQKNHYEKKTNDYFLVQSK